MHKFITITGLLLLLSLPGLGQEKQHNRIIYFKTWGMPSIPSTCEDSISYLYGFQKEIVAGCVITSRSKVKKWKRHNRRMEKLMIKRHGTDWRADYRRDVDACIKSTHCL